MHTKNSMIILFFISIFLIVHGQLSIDELFFFNSKYTSTGNCSDFQYIFSNFRINYYHYNQLIFDCNSSSIIFRNTEQISSSVCPNDINYFENFRIHFHNLSQTFIQVNQLHLQGIELCSVDNFIQNSYSEYSYYRSQWALLINLENTITNEQQHLAIASNGEMTFILSSGSNKNLIDLIFPSENIYQFNQSSINIWRIDQGYVRIPKSLDNTIIYQLSKTKFTLYNNETFFIYGISTYNPSRLAVYIDDIQLKCVYDYTIQCTFPILSWEKNDSYEPILKVTSNRKQIFNSTLTLNPRIHLNQVPINHSLTDIGTYTVDINTNVCRNYSLKSLFTLIIHLWTENINGTREYQRIPNNDIPPIDCNTIVEIGREINNTIKSISIYDIKPPLNVDLIHQWDGHEYCRAETTRIVFN